MTKPGGLAWFGATLVWAGAAVMSFAGLDGLATTCLIAPSIAWLLPIVIDLGVAVAAWVWRRGVNPEASKLAGRMTWSLLTLTVLGNGSHLGMEASHVTPPWWVAALVGAIPPAVAGAVAHLLVLLARTDVQLDVQESVQQLAPSPVVTAVTPTPSKPKRVSVAEGSDKTPSKTPGRRAVAKSLGISEYEARKMLERGEAPVNGVKVLEDAK